MGAFENRGFVAGGSCRWKFFAFCGILPDTYRAAPPRPAFKAGSLFAITVLDRGIIEVSSWYSALTLNPERHESYGEMVLTSLKLTFIAVFRAYN